MLGILLASPLRAQDAAGWERDPTFVLSRTIAGLPYRGPDGKYIVQGYTPDANGILSLELLRLNVDGSVDPFFRAYEQNIQPFAADPSGGLLVGFPFGIGRINYDGSRDPTFVYPATLRDIGYFSLRHGHYYGWQNNRPLVRYLLDGIVDPSFDNKDTTNLVVRGVNANGVIACEEVNRNSPYKKFVWLTPGGAIAATSDFAARSESIVITLPDASLMSFLDQPGLPALRNMEIRHFDATGRKILDQVFPSDAFVIAGVISDAILAAGGGDVSIDLSSQRVRTRLHIHNDQLLIQPESGAPPGLGSWFPLTRFLRKGAGPLPAIVQGISAVTVAPNQTVALTIGTTGENLRYSFARAGSSPTAVNPDRPVSGGSYTLLLPNVTPADAGNYLLTVSSGPWTNVTIPLTVTVAAQAEPSRLGNVSIRTQVGPGEKSLIVGFAVAGGNAGATQPILARGIGPTLAAFGITDFLADPVITLRSESEIVAVNDDWSGNAAVALTAAQLGAFTLPTASRDSALYQAGMRPGAYTLQLTGNGSSSGSALAEVYDAGPAGAARATAPRLINVSCRASIEKDGDGLTAGFVVVGGTAKTLLVRGVGSSLERFGIQGALPAGQLAIFDSAQRKLAESLGRGFDLFPADIGAQVGAFPLTPGGLDNVIVVTLPPGQYTAQLRGTHGSAGTALMEVYEVL